MLARKLDAVTMIDLEIALTRLSAELTVLEAVAGQHLCLAARCALDDAQAAWVAVAAGQQRLGQILTTALETPTNRTGAD